MRMSASSAADPLRALLPEQPGVLRDRVASITGAAPSTGTAARGQHSTMAARAHAWVSVWLQ